MSAEMRGGGAEETMKGWQALLISCHSDKASCEIACICCACLSEKHWPPRIILPVTDMFSLHVALKFER